MARLRTDGCSSATRLLPPYTSPGLLLFPTLGFITSDASYTFPPSCSHRDQFVIGDNTPPPPLPQAATCQSAFALSAVCLCMVAAAAYAIRSSILPQVGFLEEKVASIISITAKLLKLGNVDVGFTKALKPPKVSFKKYNKGNFQQIFVLHSG